MELQKLHYFEIPTVMKHGLGAIKYLPEEVKSLSLKKPLLVTDPGVARAGVLEQVEAVLKGGGVQYVLFDQVEPNPSIHLVARGSRLYKEQGCDGLIALGGGSSMDTSKAIGVEVTHGAPVLEYECAPGKKPLTKRIPPLICIPTTAGTGSEVTMWAVITDPARKFKFNVGGPLIPAHLALVDPELQVTLPPEITAGTGMDALCHAIECYTCAYAQPQTDAVALLAIEYVGHYLRRAVGYGKDKEARYYMSMAALLAGLSYGAESAGAGHALTQTLGGIYPVHHGLAVAACLPAEVEYNWIGNPAKFKRIALALGKDVIGLDDREGALACVEAVWELARDLEVKNFNQLGIKDEDIPMLAAAAEKDPQTIGNPRDINAKGYEWIYRRSFDF